MKDANTITHVDMEKVFSDPTFNCRGPIAPIDVTELARDIDTNGLQQPIVVKPFREGEYKIKPEYFYKIVSGHRRHKAFIVLKRDTIPCIISEDLSDAQALILNLGENLHRKDLNILQEASALSRLKLEGFSATDIGFNIGKSRQWVQVRFMLLELPEVIKEAAAAGFITQQHIKGIHKIKGMKQQIEAAVKIKEAKVRGERPPSLKKHNKRNIIKSKIRDTEDMIWMQKHIQESIGNNFGTRVLAWSAGEINDFELFQDIEKIAITADIKYKIPYELGNLQ